METSSTGWHNYFEVLFFILVKTWLLKNLLSRWKSDSPLAFQRQLSSNLMHSDQLWTSSIFNESWWEFLLRAVRPNKKTHLVSVTLSQIFRGGRAFFFNFYSFF
jgi:hypothetical protein